MVNKSNVQSSVVCSFCGKNGHNDSVCFKKHGFPNQDGKKVSHNSNRKVCTHCNRTCHTVDTCYKKHGYPTNSKMVRLILSTTVPLKRSMILTIMRMAILILIINNIKS